jgi:hypothetical protein
VKDANYPPEHPTAPEASDSTRCDADLAASRHADRQRLRALILEGAASGLDGMANPEYFDALRAHVRNSRPQR